MNIQEFLSQTTTRSIPLSELTTLAADRACYGDDCISGFVTQIQLRAQQAQAVLDSATQGNRDVLLASEQRAYDAAVRERDSILSLQHSIERRTETRAHVPLSQTEPKRDSSSTISFGPVLAPEQRVVSWLEQRGGYAYAGETGSDRLSFGRVVRAWLTGRRTDLSDLERRVLSEGTDSAGGYSVPEVLGARIIDRAREKLVTQQAGAQVIPMSSDVLHLARVASPGLHSVGSPAVPAAPTGWKVENAPIEQADVTLERITFTARTLALMVKMSVELSEDSVNIDTIVEDAFATSFAEELDRVALVGSGTPPEPRGIKNQVGVQTDSLPGSPMADYDWLIDAAGLLWTENHDPNAVIYNTSMAIALAKLKDSNNQSLTIPPALSGVRQFRSSAAGADAFLGDFRQLLLGMRMSFRLESSRVAGDAFENLQIHVRAYLRADVQLAHPEAFVVLS